MPELAEVETLKCYLEKHIIGQKIETLVARRDNLRYLLNKEKLNQHVLSGSIIQITRIAKFLTIDLSNTYSLIFHLGMSGKLTTQEPHYQPQKHDHIIVNFQSGNQLVFNDARRFGMVYSCKTNEIKQQAFLKNMGQEPLENEFNTEYLLQKLFTKRTSIKTAIMDSRLVVGVGNIYAAESLFMAHIHPLRRADTLNKVEINKLVDSIKEVLNKAIAAGGTTLKDFVNGDNKPGYFQQELSVYDRIGQSCYICRNLIQKIKQSGRSTCFCPNCQK